MSGTLSRDVVASGSSLTNTSETWTGTGGWSNTKTYTLSKTITVDEYGYIRARVGLAKDEDVYVDPKITVA